MKAYDRRNGESDVAFAAFQEYLNLGPQRSTREVAEKCQKSQSIVARWGTKWDWVERAVAWDNDLATAGRKAQIDQIRKMHRRHARAALDMFHKAVDRLATLKPEDLTNKDLVAFLTEAVTIERQARGEPGKIEAVTGKDGGPVQINIVQIIQAARQQARGYVESRFPDEHVNGSAEAGTT